MLNTKIIYYGKPKNITQVTKTNIDHFYNYMLILNCLYSHYPKELETKKMQHSISYIMKHAEGKIDLKDKTNKQIYFECCDYLDSIDKEI